jgi:hypothetical protein
MNKKEGKETNGGSRRTNDGGGDGRQDEALRRSLAVDHRLSGAARRKKGDVVLGQS